MSAGVHHLHHEEVGAGTGSHLTAAHQKEEQLLLKSCASLVISNDILCHLNIHTVQ